MIFPRQFPTNYLTDQSRFRHFDRFICSSLVSVGALSATKLESYMTHSFSEAHGKKRAISSKPARRSSTSQRLHRFLQIESH